MGLLGKIAGGALGGVSGAVLGGVLTGDEGGGAAGSAVSLDENIARATAEIEKALGHPLDPAAALYIRQTVTSKFDITKNPEGIEKWTQASMPWILNDIKTQATEAKQEALVGDVLAQTKQAMETGQELSQRQMAILEEQLGLSKSELASIQAARGEALEQARVQAESAQTAQNELYRQAGLKPTYDERGVLTDLEPMAEEELTANMNPLQQQQYQLAKATTQKQLDALAGKVDMDPALQQSLKEQEDQLRATLAQKLGPNYEKTTPGIQALSKFGEAKTRIEESARLSWIQTGQGLVTSAVGTQIGAQQAQAAATGGAALTGAQLGQIGITAPLATSPLNRPVSPGEVSGVLSTQMGGLSAAPTAYSGFQSVLAPRYAETDYQRQLALIEAQKPDSGSPWAGVLSGLLGTAASAGMAYMTGGTSLLASAGGAAVTSGAGAYSVNAPPAR